MQCSFKKLVDQLWILIMDLLLNMVKRGMLTWVGAMLMHFFDINASADVYLCYQFLYPQVICVIAYRTIILDSLSTASARIC